MKWILILFFVVRLLTVSKYPHFFDGPEYVRLSGMEWSEAMQTSHLSVHPISYAVWGGVAKIWPQGGVLGLSLVSVIMGAVGLVVVEAYLKRWGKRAMWMGGLFYIFLPLSQLIQTNVATETMTQTLLIVGLYGWQRSWRKGSWWWVGVMGVAGAIINFPGIIWWVGLLVMLGSVEGKLKEAIIGAVTSVGVGLFGLWGVYSLGGLGSERIFLLWREHGSLLTNIFSSTQILRVIYQASQAFIYNYGWGAVLIVGWLIFDALKRRDKKGWGLIIGVGAIYTISMSYWHGGIYGRPGGVMIFVLAILFVRVPIKIGLVALLLSVWAWTGTVRAYQTTPIPERVKLAVEERCQGEQLVVFSDYMRPQLTEVEGLVGERYAYVNPENVREVEEKIREVRESGGGVCVTREAWDYPYRQYDAQSRHPLQGQQNKIGELVRRVEEGSVKILRIEWGEVGEL